MTSIFKFLKILIVKKTLIIQVVQIQIKKGDIIIIIYKTQYKTIHSFKKVSQMSLIKCKKNTDKKSFKFNKTILGNLKFKNSWKRKNRKKIFKKNIRFP